MSDLPEHVARNRAYWDAMATDWVDPGRRNWQQDEPHWGVWQVPESEAKLIKGHQDEALLLLAVFAGPRQGEVLSLMRSDIKLDTGVVSFMHTLDWIDGKPVREEPKNATSRRSVRLPEYALDVVRPAAHRGRGGAATYNAY